jgi:hypothetical protein
MSFGSRDLRGLATRVKLGGGAELKIEGLKKEDYWNA